MNSDENIPIPSDDSGNESSGGSDTDTEIQMETDPPEIQNEEEYQYEVLSTEQIVQHMVDSIKEVNSVIQVRRLLLKLTLSNH